MSRTMFERVSEGFPLLETRRPISSRVQRSEGAGCIGVGAKEQDHCPRRSPESRLFFDARKDDSDAIVGKFCTHDQFVLPAYSCASPHISANRLLPQRDTAAGGVTRWWRPAC